MKTARSDLLCALRDTHLCKAAVLNCVHIRPEASIRGRQPPALPLRYLIQAGVPL